MRGGDSTTIGRRGRVRHLGEKIEAVRAGEREVEQHERAIGMARHLRERLVAMRGGEEVDIAGEVGKHLAQRVHDQRMVVDDEQLHVFPCVRR